MQDPCDGSWADIGDIMKRPAWRKMAEEKIFSRYVVLIRGFEAGENRGNL